MNGSKKHIIKILVTLYIPPIYFTLFNYPWSFATKKKIMLLYSDIKEVVHIYSTRKMLKNCYEYYPIHIILKDLSIYIQTKGLLRVGNNNA